MARRLKSIHTLYKWAAAVMSPFVALLARWERTRGNAPLTRLMDLHYRWSIRYHFFLGYNRYCKDHSRIHRDSTASIQPSLAKEYQMKAKGEL